LNKELICSIYKELIKLNTKRISNQSSLQINKRTLFKRRNTNGKEIHERMFNVHCYRENSSQNIVIPSLPSQNSHNQENKDEETLVRMWRKWDPYRLWKLKLLQPL
jgi:hypothetical protein